MVRLGFEKRIDNIEGYQQLQQGQVSDLIELIQVQGAMIAQLQTDVLLLRTENQNWATLFQLLPMPREIQVEPECPEGYEWNGRQCLKQDNLLRLSIYEREGL
jgi:hypothetical protein